MDDEDEFGELYTDLGDNGVESGRSLDSRNRFTSAAADIRPWRDSIGSGGLSLKAKESLDEEEEEEEVEEEELEEEEGGGGLILAGEHGNSPEFDTFNHYPTSIPGLSGNPNPNPSIPGFSIKHQGNNPNTAWFNPNPNPNPIVPGLGIKHQGNNPNTAWFNPNPNPNPNPNHSPSLNPNPSTPGFGIKHGENNPNAGWFDHRVPTQGEDIVEGEIWPNGEEEEEEDDDGDSLNIVLNENEPMYIPGGGGIEEEGNDYDDEDDEDLVILAGDDDPPEGHEWGDETLPDGGPLGDRLNSLGSGGATDKSTTDEKGQAVKSLRPGPNAMRLGYGSGGHGYHPSQFKYVRPGATSVSGIGQPQSGKTGLLLKGGTGRGEWATAGGRGAGAPYGYQKMPQGPWGGGTSRVLQYGDFALPPGKTVFDIDLDSLDEKSWKQPGADVSDYFNFGFSESTWKEYCKQLVQLRMGASMQSKIHVYESGRSEQEYDPDLPPELAAAVGIQDSARRHYSANDSAPPAPSGQDRGYSQYQTTVRAIQVECGSGERQPSADSRRPRFRDWDYIVLFEAEVEEEEQPIETGIDEQTRCEEDVDFEENETDDAQGFKLDSGRIHQLSQQRAKIFVGDMKTASRKDFEQLKMNQSHSDLEIDADASGFVESELQSTQDAAEHEFTGVSVVDSTAARVLHRASTPYELEEKGVAALLEEDICDDGVSEFKEHDKRHSPKRQKLSSRVAKEDLQSYRRTASNDSAERHGDRSKELSAEEEEQREDEGRRSVSRQYKRPRSHSANRDIYLDSEDYSQQQQDSLLHSRELVDKEKSHIYNKLDMYYGRAEEHKGKGRENRHSLDRRNREDDFYPRRNQKEEEPRRREDERLQRENVHNIDWAGTKRKDDDVSRRRERFARKEPVREREREEKSFSWHSNDDEVHHRRKRGEEPRRDRTEKNEGGREHRARDKHGSEIRDHERDANQRRREEDARRKDRNSDHRQWKSREESWRDRDDTHRGKAPHQRKEKDEDNRPGSSSRSRRHSLERSYHGQETRAPSDIEARDRNNKRRQDEDYAREKDPVDDLKVNDQRVRRPHRDHNSPRIQEDRAVHRERTSAQENLLISRSSGDPQSRNERHRLDKKDTKPQKNGHSSAMGDETSQENYTDRVKNENTDGHRVNDKRYEEAGLRDASSRKSEAKSDRHSQQSRRKGEHRTKASSHFAEAVSEDGNAEYERQSRSKLERWMSQKTKSNDEFPHHDKSSKLGSDLSALSKTYEYEDATPPDNITRGGHVDRMIKSRIEEQQESEEEKVDMSLGGWQSEEEGRGCSSPIRGEEEEGEGEEEDDGANLTEFQMREMSAKLEKRRERFKQQPAVSADGRKVSENNNNEACKDYYEQEDSSVKLERPARKRRWGSG